MRTIFLAAVMIGGLASGASSQCLDRLEIECLQVADYPGDVCVTLRLWTCRAPFDAFGVEIAFPSDYMTFSVLETAGTLVAGWDWVDAVVVEGPTTTVRIGGYDDVGVGVQSRAVLVRLCFALTAELPSGMQMTIDKSSMVDDIQGYEAVDCRMPSIVPAEASTWGTIKALFR